MKTRFFHARIPLLAIAALALVLLVIRIHQNATLSIQEEPDTIRTPPAPQEPLALSAAPVFLDELPATWQPYVIGSNRLMHYDGRTSIQLNPVGPDMVEITVDAFPVPPSRPSSP